MPKLPRVRTRVLTTIETRARLRAEAKFKLSPLGLQQRLLEYLEKVDPIKLIAIITGSFVVYDLIKKTPEFFAEAKIMIVNGALAGWGSILKGTNIFGNPFINWIVDIADSVFKMEQLTDEEKVVYKKIQEEFDVPLLIYSFFISYFIVEHGGTIISGVGNISKFIGGFFNLKEKV